MRVRLLNPSIYCSDNMGMSFVTKGNIEDDSMYPVAVNAEIDEYSDNRAVVSSEELDRVFPIFVCGKEHKRDESCNLGWWNNPPRGGEGVKKISWEPVTPFDYWNQLKASREVDETVGKGYL